MKPPRTDCVMELKWVARISPLSKSILIIYIVKLRKVAQQDLMIEIVDVTPHSRTVMVWTYRVAQNGMWL